MVNSRLGSIRKLGGESNNRQENYTLITEGVEEMKEKNESYNNSTENVKGEIVDVFDKKNIKNILESLPTTLFVTDKEGNVLISTSFTALTLGISLEELLKSNLKDLVEKGRYDKSFALQAVKEKKTITGVLTTKAGFQMTSTSTPIIDEAGEITFVVTAGRPQEMIDNLNNQEKKEKVKRLKREIEYLRLQKISNEKIVAESIEMRKIYKTCIDIAKTDSSILILGETGTGKEILSKHIHRNSNREKGPFITVNCAAIPEALFESELFGYEKGSFTGANTGGKVGILEIAHEGTLFLDEISEMPLSLQAKLLRVLDNNEVRRVGGTVSHKVDFRLVSASNRDLSEMVENGEFRRDLFYRINVIPIKIPPLRERPEDLIALVDKFLMEFNKKYRRQHKLSSTEVQHLLKHPWPGNVRELRNFIERAVVTNNENFERTQDNGQIKNKTISSIDIMDCSADENMTLKEFMRASEEKFVRKTLAECNGKMGKTADKLGIYRTVLYRKLKAYDSKE